MQLQPDIAALLSDAAEQGNNLILECGAEMSSALFAFLRQKTPQLGAVLNDGALYPRLTVQEYLRFFAGLWGQKQNLAPAVRAMRLEDLQHCRIKRLNHSQARRVMIAREIIHAPPLFFIEEPLRDLDEDGRALVLEWLEDLPAKVCCIATTTSFKHLCMLPGFAWRLEESGPHRLEPNPPGGPAPALGVDKIPARDGDSVFLLNPSDLDYAESAAGKTALVVRGSSFACALTLDELEAKLARYGFYRCHRSYLVNMQKVHEVVKWTRNSYSLRLEGGSEEVPLSKGRIEEIKNLYHF